MPEQRMPGQNVDLKPTPGADPNPSTRNEADPLFPRETIIDRMDPAQVLCMGGGIVALLVGLFFTFHALGIAFGTVPADDRLASIPWFVVAVVWFVVGATGLKLGR